MKFILVAVLLVFSVVCLGSPIFQLPNRGQNKPQFPIGAQIHGNENGAGGRIWGNIPMGDKGAVLKPYVDGYVGPRGGAITGGGVKLEIPFGK